MSRDGYRLHFIDTGLPIPLIDTVIDTIWCKKICDKLLNISSYFITAELLCNCIKSSSVRSSEFFLLFVLFY